MRPDFVAARGAAAWAVSNPPIFSTAPLRASLPLFAEAGMRGAAPQIARADGLAANRCCSELAGGQLAIVTPADPAQRGCQLSLRLRARRSARPSGVRGAGARSGVVCDWREPDIIRLAPVPLYNSFEDVLRGAWQLAELLQPQR